MDAKRDKNIGNKMSFYCTLSTVTHLQTHPHAKTKQQKTHNQNTHPLPRTLKNLMPHNNRLNVQDLIIHFSPDVAF